MYPVFKSQERTVALPDGSEVLLRPISPDDAERFYWFLGGLTKEDRKYLRIDVTDRNLVLDRVVSPDPSVAVRLVAEAAGEIVAEAVLEKPRTGWEADVGEIRLLVAGSHRRKGLGRKLAREIYFHAVQGGIRKVVARVMRPQKSARRIFRRLGFTEEALLPDHVKDMSGHTQDLLVMTADIAELKRELKHELASTDWRRHR